jgi:hypothetical protein
MIRFIYLVTSVIVYKPLNLFKINVIDILTYSFKGFFITGVSEALINLFNNVINVIIKSNLTKR